MHLSLSTTFSWVKNKPIMVRLCPATLVVLLSREPPRNCSIWEYKTTLTSLTCHVEGGADAGHDPVPGDLTRVAALCSQGDVEGESSPRLAGGGHPAGYIPSVLQRLTCRSLTDRRRTTLQCHSSVEVGQRQGLEKGDVGSLRLH